MIYVAVIYWPTDGGHANELNPPKDGRNWELHAIECSGSMLVVIWRAIR